MDRKHGNRFPKKNWEHLARLTSFLEILEYATFRC